MSEHEGITRRAALVRGTVAGAGLVLGFVLERAAEANTPSKAALRQAAKGGGKQAELNAWIRVGTDDTVTLLVNESEMGQGILTSLPMILADELGADWSKVRSEHAPGDMARYGRQITGGSSSVYGNYENLRKAAAAAREYLALAAATRWKVPAAEVAVEHGNVVHVATKRSATFGEVAELAAKLVASGQNVEAKLKEKSALELIGKPTKRLDVPAKVKGEAIFGMDVKVPGMLVARVVRSPVLGGKVKGFDAKAARAVPGVRDVVQISTGVAVLADHFWAAKKGSEALEVAWDEGPNAALSSAAITEELRALVKKGGIDAKKTGDVPAALAKAAKKLEAVYEVPYLAHATMEPLNATAHVTKTGCEIWAPTQAQTPVQQAAAKLTGFPAEKIVVHTTFLGGGFGRKAHTDFVAEAVELSKKVGKPVKIVWTREDDLTGGQYRPIAYNELAGGVDAQGWPVAWAHHIASPSILEGAFGLPKDGIDRTAVEGAENLPYSIPNLHVTWAKASLPPTVWFWRSVGSSINGFVTECFLDELAALGGKDPLEVRRRLLDQSPRHKKVLEVAAEQAGWGTPLPKGRARGLAVHFSFGSFVAEVAEVSIEDGKPRVHRVVCAVDSGGVVNPSTIVEQMESAIVYGLSAALYGEITFEKGRVVQRGFEEYPVLRMADMPVIETHLVPSGDALGGIGEPGTPPVAAAVANAIFALTKRPVRKLPMKQVG